MEPGSVFEAPRAKNHLRKVEFEERAAAVRLELSQKIEELTRVVGGHQEEQRRKYFLPTAACCTPT